MDKQLLRGDSGQCLSRNDPALHDRMSGEIAQTLATTYKPQLRNGALIPPLQTGRDFSRRLLRRRAFYGSGGRGIITTTRNGSLLSDVRNNDNLNMLLFNTVL